MTTDTGDRLILSFCHEILVCLLTSLSSKQKQITETYLYNFDSLKPHFYIVKLWFTGVYIIFLISAQTRTHNLYFVQKYKKILEILSENFQFLVVKFSIFLNRYVFVMKPFKYFLFTDSPVITGLKTTARIYRKRTVIGRDNK